jgi:predicted permease
MTRLYRMLLLAYPAGFRREYGDEMVAMFAERAAQTGTLGRIGLLLGAVPEVLANALPMHGEMLGQDLRYTARTLRRAPGFALTAILVTALGVGANAAAFSVADFVLVRPLAYPESESLVRLCEGPRTGPVGWGCMNQLSPANFRDFQEQTTSFEALGAYMRNAVNLLGVGEPQRLAAAQVTPEVLPLLGVRPLVGTVFEDGGGAGARTVVLSHGLWQTGFGGDPAVLGRVVNLDGLPHTVIGVMPRDFYFPTREAQLWTSFELGEEDFAQRNNNYLEAVGRLADGVTFERARADLDAVVERLAQTYPENAETGVSFFRMRDEFSPRFRLMLQALCGASLCILLLACANLGNLLLVRAGARERELAVRAAMGAGRERLVRQMITESITLAAIGGAAGVLLAWLVFPLLSLLIPSTLPIASRPELNLRVLALAGGFAALTGLGFGLVPALRAGGRALATLRGGRSGGPKRSYRSILVGVEVAASVVLLASSGLLIRAMLRVQGTDPGFRSQGVLTLQTVLPKPKYDSTDVRERFYEDVLTAVRGVPEVRAAAFTSGLPLVMIGGIASVVLPGQEVPPAGPGPEYLVSRRYVTPQFFSAMGIPLVAGRDFEDADVRTRARVAVVSESFAERYWPEGNPLGRPFVFRGEEWTVIGVVGDVKFRGLERRSEPQLYAPSSMVPNGPLNFYDPKSLVIRVTGEESAILPAVREIVRGVDPDQPISDVMSLTDLLTLQTSDRRAQVNLLAALAALALLLAGLGINGVLAYAVAQRRQEIAVRLALGAEPGRIARRVVWDGASIVVLGMIPGLILAWMAGRYLSALLFGVPPGDPATIVTTVGLCLVTALVGASLPALHAVRVSPMSVMRAE